jgi:NADPH:quinone reductase-like Zn-dependent oxidoreductase
MKVVQFEKFGPPEVLFLAETPQPVPGDNEVLIKIHAAALTAIDTVRLRPPGSLSGAKPRRSGLGYYLAGEVAAVGRAVTRFKKGDRVFGGDVWTTGAYAEFKCLPENKVGLIKPPQLTCAEAALLTYGGVTALPFLREVGRLRKGQKVLVIGASGAIGTCAVQLAGCFGAEVTGVCSSAGLDLVKSLGASQVIDYTREDFTHNGRTYDIIFDTPAKYSFSLCKGSLTPRGRYLTTVPWPKDLLAMLWTALAGRKKAIFRPMGLRSTRQKARDLAFLQELVAAGRIKPVIDRAFPLEQIVQAFHYAAESPKQGNIVITMHHPANRESG